MSLGCDIVHINRFETLLARTPAMRERIFTVRERENTDIAHLAGIFAAKEAVMKALGLRPGNWHTIEIIKDKLSKPTIKFHGINVDIKESDISISHDGEYVFAVAMFLISD